MSVEQPTTVLGDWYATLIHAPRLQVVLVVSERTLLPVVVPAREARTLLPRFRVALAAMLIKLDVRPSVVEREMHAMDSVTVGKTRSRTVLGSMNDFIRMSKVDPWPPSSLEELSLELACAPSGPIGMKSPDDLTRDLLNAEGLQRATVETRALSGGYSVSVPELPGCFTEGETAVEIRRMVREAIGLWLEAASTPAAARRREGSR